jgi:Tol biopolymer transport system component
LAFLSEGYDNYNLCVINSDETGLHKLDVIASGMPAWSPDGKWIAYPMYPWAQSLGIVSVDGRIQKELLSDSDYGEWFAPFWMH